MDINLCAGINTTGYGIVATNVLKHLVRQKHKVTLFPIGGIDTDDSIEVAKCAQEAYGNQENYNFNSAGLKIWHQFALADKYSKVLNAGLTFFELDKLTNKERCHINSLDVLFVASQWANDIVKSQTDIKSVTTVPMGVDTDIFYPTPINYSRAYRFFSTGKLEKRKGHDIIIELFNKAFDIDDDVELHLKVTNPFISIDEYNNFLCTAKSSKLREKIFFHTTTNQREVANIMQSSDCGLFPTRSEGFGLGVLEGIACHKPIISTNYSAIPDFCTGENTFLVEPDCKEDAHDNKWFFGFGQWASFQENSIEQFIHFMRYCYNNRIQSKDDSQSILDTYNWDNTVKTIVNTLDKFSNTL